MDEDEEATKEVAGTPRPKTGENITKKILKRIIKRSSECEIFEPPH